ncbi:putative NADH dehydrogenase/NAD(P)H nitroreductase [Marmoricola endophyticus]|uniref:NADH dehydrogenase/NAD(P)H nitroreductase n=1 Tax=Marmoricola endophyticus TaxID=2040280 RepID=A0A917F6Z8_9ACTN|nr:malonic semialdehyde reductase [Marmoricola endophyticus]GGF49970.1 putative NADH dehydrogenase/NAD(P)H nitroreductase [Marmoricola endophyticus]
MTTSTLETLSETGRSLLFSEARTANTFADVPVGDEQLRSIWELARFSPTMANSQPQRVLFVRTPEGKQRLAVHLAEGNRAKALGAPVVAVLAYDTDFHQQFPTTFPARGEALKEQFGGMDEEARGHVAKYSAALATGVLLLAIRSHGLAAGPMAGFDAAGIDEEFFAGTTWHSHLVVNIGHPGSDPWFDRLPRVDVDDALAWA